VINYPVLLNELYSNLWYMDCMFQITKCMSLLSWKYNQDWKYTRKCLKILWQVCAVFYLVSSLRSTEKAIVRYRNNESYLFRTIKIWKKMHENVERKKDKELEEKIFEFCFTDKHQVWRSNVILCVNIFDKRWTTSWCTVRKGVWRGIEFFMNGKSWKDLSQIVDSMKSKVIWGEERWSSHQ